MAHVAKTKKRGRLAWYVDYYEGFNGPRRRKFFKTRERAEEFYEVEARDFGTKGRGGVR